MKPRLFSYIVLAAVIFSGCLVLASADDDVKRNLFSATTRGDTDAVQAVIQAHPDLAAATNPQGVTPLLLAIYMQKSDVIAVMLRDGVQPNIFEAAALGDAKRVGAILDERAADANAFSGDGFTALHLAAYFGRASVASMLIDRGADVNVKSRNSVDASPLQSAAAGKRQQIAELLLEHHADPNVRGEGGYTPLHEVASNGMLELAKLLLDHGANINAKADDGKTPLAAAEEAKFTTMAALLRDHGGTE